MRPVWILMIGLAVAGVAGLGGCEKDSASPRKEPWVGEDGLRRVPIEAGKRGYVPDRVSAKPNEKLFLVFTRTAKGECTSQVKVADGAVQELPMNTPVEIAVTAPASGDLSFACGMDMLTGVIAVN